MDTRLLTRVTIRNYKSIAACDVHPGPLTFLVGPNGSGKSNFLDALRFVSDSLRYSLDHAFRDRGGINDVRRRSSGHPTHFGIRLEFQLARQHGHYSFSIGARPRSGFVVHEECHVVDREEGATSFFKVTDGVVVKSTLRDAPAAASDRLYLVTLSGIAAFRGIYNALSTMGFYNLNPDAIRDLQSPDPGELLNRDGSNIASVLANLNQRAPRQRRMIEEYLERVVPGISGVDAKQIGPKETLEIQQAVRGAKNPRHFFAASMSDGTLRALGVLVALFQHDGVANGKRRLIGIEEPEAALHPAAAGVLTDGLRDAAEYSQVLVTSHSPDLLDDDDIPEGAILAVVSEDGETRIGPLDGAARSVLKDHLYTAGELLRMNQLQPDPETSRLSPDQIELFGAADSTCAE